MKIIGLDIGSVSIASVLTEENGLILSRDYRFHHGDIENNLKDSLTALGITGQAVIMSTKSSPDIISGASYVDDKVAFIKGASGFFPDIGSLLVVGAQSFFITHFSDTGAYKRSRSNSSCAAGTGSFLDQQARRLNLKDSGELASLALKNTGEIPRIASRCAVFAKTDLIHAQAEGYSLVEICDGLCHGLAKNIVDTLVSDEKPPGPLVFAGGVSLNKAVVGHLERLLDTEILTVPDAPFFGALGAAAAFLAGNSGEIAAVETAEILKSLSGQRQKKKEYFYPSLSLSLSGYPDFKSLDSFLFPALKGSLPVETDVYIPVSGRETLPVSLGIDIGSTSTKAVLMSGQDVLAGFYTRTSGNPLSAVQGIFEAIRFSEDRLGVSFSVTSAATTGSGRKFIGKILGADLVVDEITAHARAAYQLDPRIDTIIEIGGQDSKFTVLNNGRVSFSQMNTICAAGTGSFLEEQAQKLGVSLTDYSGRAENKHAPLTSDRCTVFMERDLNNYLAQDYSVDELLAAALFSVRENYLRKVASEAQIGNFVCFQGATAKNKALVAAFEQKLGRPIFVSPFCHLTGAIGAALIALQEQTATVFRGFDIFQKPIPIRSEICGLCANHCRIRIAQVKGETVAFGFLCGRDYDTRKYVEKNTSGFDLLKVRKKIFSGSDKPLKTVQDDPGYQRAGKLPVIGLPAGLYMLEQLPLWKRFFSELGFPVFSSDSMEGPAKIGKNLTGAEFCAPLTALHGHADFASDNSDVLFLPIILEAGKERHEEGAARQYCYYTQYGPSLIKAVINRRKGKPVLTPYLKPGNFPHNLKELTRVLYPYLKKKTAPLYIARALASSEQYMEGRREQLAALFEQHFNWAYDTPKDVRVALLGRPYIILSPAMNNRIPDIFASLGVKAFFQDMLPDCPEAREELAQVLSAFHWKQAAAILEAAAFTAKTPGLYPVFITSFKCSPDSFALDYFKRILQAKNKPYLILQLDEHDSSVGYETRIEAGLRAFRNHFNEENSLRGLRDKAAAKPAVKKPFDFHLPSLSLPEFKISGYFRPANPVLERDLTGKTLLFPRWDSITGPLLTANLRRIGINAILLPETPLSIRKSMRLNTAQCLPVNVIAQEAMDYVLDNNLDPGSTVLWMAKSKIACNIPMYPYYIKSLFEEAGKGMEKVGVYLGDLSHMELSPRIAVYTYFAYMFGGLLRKLGCRVRPYEVNPGETDRLLEFSVRMLEEAFLKGGGFGDALEKIISRFESLPRHSGQKPKVAVFGDLYVRDNDIMNQDLIHTIEKAGGEVITTPYNEYAKIISKAYFKKWFKKGEYMNWLKNRSLLAAAELVEKKYYAFFKDFFTPGEATSADRVEELLGRFHLTLDHDGESMENILKIFSLLEEHPDIALFVQASPSYCCPGLVTEAMNRDIERITGVPVVSLTYDGTGAFQNDQIVPYLALR